MNAALTLRTKDENANIRLLQICKIRISNSSDIYYRNMAYRAYLEVATKKGLASIDLKSFFSFKTFDEIILEIESLSFLSSD